MFMKRQYFLLILLSAMAGLAHADGEIYKCVGPGGTVEYKNNGPTKDCKKIDMQGISVIPAPAPTAKKPAGSGGVQTASLKSSSSPADFPRVDTGTQKARDNDRHQILMDEMKSEQDKLAALKKDYNNGEPERQGNEANYAKYQERVAAMKDDISRTEKNIEALQRELKRDGGDIK
jgi:hypothetical protein